MAHVIILNALGLGISETVFNCAGDGANRIGILNDITNYCDNAAGNCTNDCNAENPVESAVTRCSTFPEDGAHCLVLSPMLGCCIFGTAGFITLGILSSWSLGAASCAALTTCGGGGSFAVNCCRNTIWKRPETVVEPIVAEALVEVVPPIPAEMMIP